MKKAKKVLSFLTAAMMLGGVAVPAEPLAQLGAVMMVRAEEESAPTSGTCGENLTWNFDESTGTLTISGTGEMENYHTDDIPWLSYVDDIEHVSIEKGVTSIGEFAFFSCTSLTSVTIPDSVTGFGGKAFYDTPWLKKQLSLAPYLVVNHVAIASNPETCTGDLVFPKNVTSINDYAFEGCDSLTSVTIPDTVTSIGEAAFQRCSSLTSVKIPDSVTSIGDLAFNSCSSLTSVTIPESVTSIGGWAFQCCSSLTSVTIPDSVTLLKLNTFGVCTSLTSVTIPDSVTNIDGAFHECTSLTSVTIPDSVTNLGYFSFYNCTSLTSIIIGNPDCEIFDDPSTICDGYIYETDSCTFTGTIYGYENSTAQAYAEKYGYNFDTIDHAPKPVDTLGDVSGDNVINAGDAAVTLSAAAAYGATGSYGDMTAAQIAAADIDGSGMVNASDAAYILQYAAIKGANGKEFDIRELVK